MNKNVILLLLLLAIFAGCSGTQVQDNATKIVNVTIDTKDIKTLENESVKIQELESVETKTSEEFIEKEVPKIDGKVVEKVTEEKVEEVPLKTQIKLYKYPFELNGKTTNIQMYNTLEQLEENNFKIGISKEELLDTETFDFIFNSKPSSNGAVAKVSGRLFPVLSVIFKFPMTGLDNILYSDVLTCKDSTLSRKLVMFDSDSKTNEVAYDSVTGCIEFKTTSQGEMGTLGDKFFYELFSE
jgi:hypothetical protein